MQVTVEKLSPVLLELQIEVSAEQVKNEVDKAYAALQRTARVRGFRPGKAPRQILAHLYGGRIHADVTQRLVDSTLNKALADKQVQPLNQPAIAPSELRPDDTFSYKARFEVRPEIAGLRWEGFEVKRNVTAPTDAMIDAEIESLRRQHATLQAPDPERPAATGDVLTLSFLLDVEGKPQEGGREQEIEADLGSGQLFKELEAALEGMSPGQKKDVTITFPERHSSPELRGKTGLFHLTLKDVKIRVFPEVDDDFAKDINHESLAALRASLREKLDNDLKRKADDALAESLVAELCKRNPIPVPPSMIERQVQAAERELSTTARRQGQRFEPTADMRAALRAESEMKVRAGLLMAEIAKERQIVITEQDIEKGYEELAAQTGKNVAKVKAEHRDPKKREMLVGMIMEDKILNLLEEASKITDAA
jgi:trigger factor